MQINQTIYKDLKVKNGDLMLGKIKLFEINFKEDDNYYNNLILKNLKDLVKLNSTKKELQHLFDNLDKCDIEINDKNATFKYHTRIYSFMNFNTFVHLSINRIID